MINQSNRNRLYFLVESQCFVINRGLIADLTEGLLLRRSGKDRYKYGRFYHTYSFFYDFCDSNQLDVLQITHLQRIFNQTGLLIIILLWSCANPVAPTGGPRDVTPPEVVVSQPENRSLNFSQNQIQLTFSEYVQVKSVKEQVIISPPFEEEPEFKMRGKTVTINFKDTLRENSTYTIFLGKAITDITENNPLTNYWYVFSTGHVLDSCSLHGRVVNAFTLQPEFNVHVALFDAPGDSVPYHERPYYVARTDSSGIFHFYHLRDLQYLLFAVKETNGNYMYDDPNEQIAFSDTLIRPWYIPEPEAIDLTDSTPQLRAVFPEPILYLFQETDSSQRILENKAFANGSVRLVFRMPVRHPAFRSLDSLSGTPWYMPEWNVEKDTLILWLLRDCPDTAFMEVTDQTTIIDTVRILTSPIVRDTRSKNEEGGEKLLITNNTRGGKLDPFRQLTLHFSHPVVRSDLSRLKLIAGRDTLDTESAFSDSLHRKLTIPFMRQADSSYHLFIPDSTFISLRGTSHDTIIFPFSDRKKEEYGSMVINLTGADTSGQYIVQLLTEKEMVAEQRLVHGRESDKIEFPWLNPGKYRMKIIVDRNRNEQWDTGHYIMKREPEKVQYFEKVLDIRANWVSEETWQLSDK